MLAGVAHTKCLSISLLGKLQNPTKPTRSKNPNVETDNLLLSLWLAHVCLTTFHILSFFFTVVLLHLEDLFSTLKSCFLLKCWLKTLHSLCLACTMMVFMTSIVSSN